MAALALPLKLVFIVPVAPSTSTGWIPAKMPIPFIRSTADITEPSNLYFS